MVICEVSIINQFRGFRAGVWAGRKDDIGVFLFGQLLHCMLIYPEELFKRSPQASITLKMQSLVQE